MFDFAALVGLLAVGYAGLSKFLQNKLIDRKEVEAMQAESKRLSAEFEKAKKANDKKRMDKAMQDQMDHLPKLNGVMMKQMKPTFVILIMFMGFMWVVGQLDPFVQDDVRLELRDDGAGCDKVSGDGVFSGCIIPESANRGKWTVLATAYEGDAHFGANETYFILGGEDPLDTFVEAGKGEEMAIRTDKTVYYGGESVAIYAAPAKMTKGSSFIIQLAEPRESDVDRVEAVVSNGTYFRVELPIAIPLLDVKTIFQPYWWFILVSLIGNLAISFVMGKMKKKEAE
ncbi:MAG: EMC3/TMCO1 family protein [Candidatus Micrarchaeota archaeon]